MPQLVSFRGHPIKRRRRCGDHLLLILFSPNPGEPGQRLLVSQAEWHRHGSIRFLSKDQLPDVRALAAQRDSDV